MERKKETEGDEPGSMSAIYKLSIQGIRSFDSNDRETIEFGTPLTLIVGMNGSGKTTIIECLKYATTGDLPPNSKGGVFVHDPKITGEKDVRAQVKLAFTSANGLNMIVTRNIQLLAKKTTNTFKTLEGQLVAISKAGDRTTLTTRSVELDTQVPLYLGVPKAILEYVIFCHQEDSLWPLSEPSNLKKRFDEIFQAMKFMKALDNLKVIKKDMAVDIKLLQQSVEHLRLDRDRAKATRVNIYQIQGKLDQYQSEVEQIESKLNEITEQSDRLFASNQKFQEVLSRVDHLKTLRSMTQNEIERLENSIERVNLPRERLREMLTNFSEELRRKEGDVRELESNLHNLKAKESSLQNRRNLLMKRLGELEHGEVQYQKNLELLETTRYVLSREHKLDSVGMSTDELLKKLETIRSESQDQLDNYSNLESAKIHELQGKLNNVTYSEAAESQSLKYSNADKQKLLSEITHLKSQISSSGPKEGDIEEAKALLDQYGVSLKELEEKRISEEIDGKIEQRESKILELEKNLEHIQEHLVRANQKSDLFARFGITKERLEAKRKDLDLLQQSLKGNERISEWKLFKSTTDIEATFREFFIDLQRSIAISNKELRDNDKAYNEATYRVRNTEEELQQIRDRESKLVEKVNESLPEDCPMEKYSEVLQEAELSYKTALENLKMHQTTLEFNKKALEVAENNNCCYLCSRPFETDDFRSKLLEELKMRTTADFENQLKEAASESKEYLDELRALENDIFTIESLRKRASELQIELTTLKKEKHSLGESLAKSESQNKKLKDDREYADKEVNSLITKISTTQAEVRSLEREYGRLSDELQNYGSADGTIQTVGELQEEQQRINEELKKCRQDMNALQQERENENKKYSTLVNQIREKSAEVNEMEKLVMRKNNIMSDITSKERDTEDISRRIDVISTKLETLRREREKLSREVDERKTKYELELSDRQLRVKSTIESITKLSELYSGIKTFEQRGKIELAECKRNLTDSERELSTLQNSIEKINNELNVERQWISDSNTQRRNLKQSIEVLDLNDKLESIDMEISKLNIQQAEVERDEYQRESSRLRGLYEKLSAENAGKLGEMKQLQKQIDSLTHQLRTDYKDIDAKYHREWVALQTRNFITDDIDTYSRAMDNAIMRYHGLKMEDINRIIDELWKRTYSGTDIDTIKIRSDEISSTSRGKSYNYRVVMYKQDAELDMRGRCSAGQKVLASIIIRLALSETFGLNCGVIALDEPTTNLDEENIESLAKSLHNIIELRRHQKNFQLIVITHDEKFLSYMNAASFTDHFFKVMRDDRQKSQIEWVDISRVSE